MNLVERQRMWQIDALWGLRRSGNGNGRAVLFSGSLVCRQGVPGAGCMFASLQRSVMHTQATVAAMYGMLVSSLLVSCNQQQQPCV